MVCSDVLLIHHTRSISGKGLTSSHSRGEKEMNLRVKWPHLSRFLSAPCFVLPVLAKLVLEAGRGVRADLGLTGQSTVCSAGQKCKRNRERRFNLLIYLFFFL